MLLRLSVIATTARAAHDGRALVDAELDVAAGAPVRAVADQLRSAAGAAGDLWVGGRRLAPDAPLGVPPLVEGAVVAVGGPGTVEHAPPGLLQLRVESGPDAGAVLGLEPGSVRIGRALGVELRLDDPDCSRVHALLDVGWDGMAVRDLGSTNGTQVAGARVGDDPVPLPLGARVRVGASTLVVAVPDDVPATVTPDGGGRLAVNRPPRLDPPAEPAVVHLPVPPQVRERGRFPLAAVLLPLVFAVAVAAVLRQPVYLLFGLLSPLLLGGQWLADRSSSARADRRAVAVYEAGSAVARDRIAAAVVAEAAALHLERPSAAAVSAAAAGPTTRLWGRRPEDTDWLLLRVGLGTLPASVSVVSQPTLGPPPQPEPPLEVPDVPLAVPLAACGVLGVAAPRSRLLGMGRWVLVQLASLHSPRHLELVVLAPGDPGAWAWARWLPHLRWVGSAGPVSGPRLRVAFDEAQVGHRVAELLAVLAERQAAARGGRGWVGPSTVVVLDGARRLRAVPGVVRLLADGPAVGLHAVCLEEDAEALPAECRARAVVAGAVATELRLDEVGQPTAYGMPDAVSTGTAERIARRLAALRDATPDDAAAALPTESRLVDLLAGEPGAAPPRAADVAAAWRRRPRSTSAVIGTGLDGPVVVDLVRDGPHALVAGTTGAGKSELLQTLVASLALGNRPDELTFLLVDYKGGAAFAGCSGLPHTVGMVTDLDDHLTARALASLTAELERRERALARAGVPDLTRYQSLGREPLPRLVIVVDEFATLAEELPDFVRGLVGVAMRGRSLGISLVLATQRPAGAVSADIRANVGMRVALRVADAADSLDVIDSPVAAGLSPGTPGRAYLRRGPEPLVALQTARVTGGAPGAARAHVAPVDLLALGEPRPPTRPVSVPDDASDLAAVVEAVRGAAASLGISQAPSPWLPPLPAVVDLASLAGRTDAVVRGGGPGSLVVPYGLLDLPTGQRQAVAALDLEGGSHLLVVGSPRAGRTTLLRSVAAGVAALSPDDVHCWALDCGSGGLAAMADLPHCGAVVTPEQPDRVERLLRRLQAEVRRRAALLGGAGYADVAEQRAAAAPGEALPVLLLVIDRWEGFLSAFDDLDGGRLTEQVLGLLREGPAVGLRAVVTADRSGLLGRLGSSIADKLVLRLADRNDAALAGLDPRALPADPPAGRGLRAANAVALQIAVAGGEASGAAQVAHLRRLAAAAAQPEHGGPLRIADLPELVRWEALRGSGAAGDVDVVWATVGLGGDDAAPVGFDLDADGPVVVVAGPGRSGRSTALVTMTRTLLDGGVSVGLVAPRRSPLRDLAERPGVLWLLTSPADAGPLRFPAANDDLPGVLVVDDTELLLDTALGSAVEAYVRGARDGGRAVLLGGTTSELLGAFRGLAVEARKARAGVLLAPASPIDGDLLGVRLPRSAVSRGPRGRGVLVVDGEVTPVQVACADPAPAAPAALGARRLTVAAAS